MRGQVAFEKFFKSIYADRWDSIYAALLVSEKQMCRWSQFTLQENSPPPSEAHFNHCTWYEKNTQPERGESGLLNFYVMDPASIVVARSLQIQPGDRVLDMCAAPGGKSLILAESIREAGELICNEPSAPRRERLKKVIQQYIPRDIRDRVWVTGTDGVRVGLKNPDEFDAILVDAPCSGERHLLHSPKDLAEWSESRTKNLAQKQYGLICSALLALKSGGRLVYSTCSLSPFENDGVIEKFLKKKGDEMELTDVLFDHPHIEKTKFGWAFLPDRSGFGPMYFSVLQKK